jgi:tRNA(fMet)-specific endonuclease VapC
VKRYLLDTNTVSHLVRGHPAVKARITSQPIAAICISVITEAELLFGLAKRPEAKRLHNLVHEFLKRAEVLDWDRAAADCYGRIRAALERQGQVVAPLDLLIGAHALSRGLAFVTNDQSFRHMVGLEIEDWT